MKNVRNLQTNYDVLFGKQYVSKKSSNDSVTKNNLDKVGSFNKLLEEIKKDKPISGIDWLIQGMNAKNGITENLGNETLKAFKELSLNTSRYFGAKKWTRGFQKATVAIGYIIDCGVSAFKADGYLDIKGIRVWLDLNRDYLIAGTDDVNIVEQIIGELDDDYFKNIHLDNKTGSIKFAEKSNYSRCSINISKITTKINKENELDSLKVFLNTYSCDNDKIPNPHDWIRDELSKEETKKSPFVLFRKILTYYFITDKITNFDYNQFSLWFGGFIDEFHEKGNAFKTEYPEQENNLDEQIFLLLYPLNHDKSFIQYLVKSLQNIKYDEVQNSISRNKKIFKMHDKFKELGIDFQIGVITSMSDACIEYADSIINNKIINNINAHEDRTERDFLLNLYEFIENKDELKKESLRNSIVEISNDTNLNMRISINASRDELNESHEVESLFERNLLNLTENTVGEYKDRESNESFEIKYESKSPFEKMPSNLRENPDEEYKDRESNEILGIRFKPKELDLDIKLQGLKEKYSHYKPSILNYSGFRENKDKFLKEHKVGGGAKKYLVELPNDKYYVVVSDPKKVDNEFRQEEEMAKYLDNHQALAPYCSPQKRINNKGITNNIARISSADDPTYLDYLNSKEFKEIENKKRVVLDMIKSYHKIIYTMLTNSVIHKDLHLGNLKRNIIDLSKKDRAFDFGFTKFGDDVREDPLFDFRYLWIGGDRKRKFQNLLSRFYNPQKLDKHFPILRMLEACGATPEHITDIESLMEKAYYDNAKQLLNNGDNKNTKFHEDMANIIQTLELEIAKILSPKDLDIIIPKNDYINVMQNAYDAKNYQYCIYLYNSYNFEDKYSNFKLHSLLAETCSCDELLNLDPKNKFFPSKFLVDEFNKLDKDTKKQFMIDEIYKQIINRACTQSGIKLTMDDRIE